MKRKAIALLLSFTMLSLSTTAYAADTVQNAPTINSSGKVVIGNTDITIDSKDLTDLASAFNNNATILTNVKDIAEQNETNIATSSDEYSSSKTYKQGGLCIRNGSLYQCTSEITTPESWNASHWKKTSLTNINSNIYKEVNELDTNLGGFTPVIDETGKITGYKTTVGADTVFPFKSCGDTLKTVCSLSSAGSYTVTEDGVYLVFCAGVINDTRSGDYITRFTIKKNGENVTSDSIYIYDTTAGANARGYPAISLFSASTGDVISITARYLYTGGIRIYQVT